MYRYPKGRLALQLAKQTAEENCTYYGFSVFGGDWFVGTIEELTQIGVAVPTPCLKLQKDESK